MPKAWCVLVNKSGPKYPFVVALNNPLEAQAAAINRMGTAKPKFTQVFPTQNIRSWA